MPSTFWLAPIAFFIAAAAAPFACGESGASSTSPHDASDENLSVPRHFEAGSGEGEAAGDAPDEYAARAAHCVRAADAGAPDPFDAGGDALPDVIAPPQVVSFGGPTLTAPSLVSVTFPGDPLADALEDFLASVGCTPYWRTIGSDYGIGDAVASTPVRVAETAPAAIDDMAIRTWLATKIEKHDPQFPRPAADTIYVVSYPAGTVITAQGAASCQSFGGYHQSGQLTDGTPFTYAVLPRCKGDDPSGLAWLTLAASHELIEASTDPRPETSPAYAFPDANHIGWGLASGAEVGDMCEFNIDYAYVPPGFPWVVQRIWSNRAAWAGETPCVPADTPSYFYATAVPMDMAMLNLLGTPQAYPAVHVAVGTTGTVAVQLVGNGLPGMMQLQAVDPDVLFGRQPHLSLTLDSAVGAPGATVHLTIQKLHGDPSGVEPFLLETTMNGRQTLSWGVTSD